MSGSPRNYQVTIRRIQEQTVEFILEDPHNSPTLVDIGRGFTREHLWETKVIESAGVDSQAVGITYLEGPPTRRTERPGDEYPF